MEMGYLQAKANSAMPVPNYPAAILTAPRPHCAKENAQGTLRLFIAPVSEHQPQISISLSRLVGLRREHCYLLECPS